MWHIYPCNDLKEHAIHWHCNCEPVIYVMNNGELLAVHNSYDGRENIEKLIQVIYCN